MYVLPECVSKVGTYCTLQTWMAKYPIADLCLWRYLPGRYQPRRIGQVRTWGRTGGVIPSWPVG